MRSLGTLFKWEEIMGIFDRVKGVSRRDLFKIAGTYGMTSTCRRGGWCTYRIRTGSGLSSYKRRYAKAKVRAVRYCRL